MNDPDEEAIRQIRRRGPLGGWRSLVVVAAGFATVALVAWFTQPWPRRGPGGGFGANNWAPLAACFAGLAVAGALVRALRRR